MATKDQTPPLTVWLAGSPQPLTSRTKHYEELWEALQDLEDPDDFISWPDSRGLMMVVRRSYVASAQVGEPGLNPDQPAPEGALIWLAGRSEPLAFSADPQEWLAPMAVLSHDEDDEEEGPEWLGWLDKEGRGVLVQIEHLVAMVYPQAWDEAFMRRVEAEAARQSRQQKKRRK